MSEKRSKYLSFAIPERTEHWLFVFTFATIERNRYLGYPFGYYEIIKSDRFWSR